MPTLQWLHGNQAGGHLLQHAECEHLIATRLQMPRRGYLEGVGTKVKGEALCPSCPQIHRHILPTQHSHLHVLDAITISVIIALVPDAIIVSILLP